MIVTSKSQVMFSKRLKIKAASCDCECKSVSCIGIIPA